MTESSTRPTGVNTTLVGRSYAPTETYEVSRVKIAEMARATGATHPAHYDPDAAWALGYADVVATPTFAVVVAQRAEQAYVGSAGGRASTSPASSTPRSASPTTGRSSPVTGCAPPSTSTRSSSGPG